MMTMKLPSENKVGLLVIVVALLSLAQLLYVTYDNRQTTECQAAVNKAFLDTIKQRASINDADRQAVKDLVDAYGAAKTDKERANAAAEFNTRYNDLQALRDSFVYPNVTGEC